MAHQYLPWCSDILRTRILWHDIRWRFVVPVVATVLRSTAPGKALPCWERWFSTPVHHSEIVSGVWVSLLVHVSLASSTARTRLEIKRERNWSPDNPNLTSQNLSNDTVSCKPSRTSTSPQTAALRTRLDKLRIQVFTTPNTTTVSFQGLLKFAPT